MDDGGIGGRVLVDGAVAATVAGAAEEGAADAGARELKGSSLGATFWLSAADAAKTGVLADGAADGGAGAGGVGGLSNDDAGPASAGSK
jgi:hypothetical protein